MVELALKVVPSATFSRILRSMNLDNTNADARGFQHSQRDLANVNQWKIIFNPYIVTVIICILLHAPKELYWTRVMAKVSDIHQGIRTGIITSEFLYPCRMCGLPAHFGKFIDFNEFLFCFLQYYMYHTD